MSALKRLIRTAFDYLEAVLDRLFGSNWNPIAHLGALGFFFYWIVAASGIYLYIFFDTGVVNAYASVEALTREQWYAGGILRSFHRYASDAMVLIMAVHIVREFALDRLRGARWFTWFTGVPILWFVYASGITGYWLVWDKLAQYVAVATTELLDTLPIFGPSIAGNFLAPESLDDRFFTLMAFLHIAIPLILLFVLWIHLQRLSRPEVNPPKRLAAGALAMLLVLSILKPAVSHAPANLAEVPTVLNLDWFYLVVYPLFDRWGGWPVWGLLFGGSLLLAVLPWLPRLRQAGPATVDLENCNGCGRCQEDCPYAAVIMGRRTDRRPFRQQAVVDPDLCVRCGICVGACPTATPFRRASALVPGIDLADNWLRGVRERTDAAAATLSGTARILVFACRHGADTGGLAGCRASAAAVALPCVAALPPSFIDYALSRGKADGIVLSGCRDGDCYNRFGDRWLTLRLARERDPRLRARVPRERILRVGAAPIHGARLAAAVDAFAEAIAGAGEEAPARH